MTPEWIAAIAAMVAAVGGVVSAIAAIAGATRAENSRQAAVQARDLITKTIQANTQANTQTNAPQFHFHGPTTVGNMTAPPQRDLVFPAEAVPAAPIADASPAPGEAQPRAAPVSPSEER